MDDNVGLIATLDPHRRVLKGVAVNNSYVATCSEDATTKIWARDGRLVTTLSLKAACRGVALNTASVAVASKDNLVSVFRLPSGRLVHALKGHSSGIRSVAMTDAFVASGSKDKTARVWNVENGAALHCLHHAKCVNAVKLNTDFLATAAEDQQVRLWHLKDGSQFRSLEMDKAFRSASLAINSNRIATASASAVQVWKISDGQLLQSLDTQARGLGSKQSPFSGLYPRLDMNEDYLIIGGEMRDTLVCSLADYAVMHQQKDTAGLSYDFYCAIHGHYLALGAGKGAKLFDLSVHAGHRRMESERLGVHIKYLTQEFKKTAQEATGSADPNFHEIAPKLAYGEAALGKDVVCPRDARMGSAIVDALDDEHRGVATHFLSWAWSYKLSTVVDALQGWMNDSDGPSSSACLWICFFCNNQFRILQEKSKEGSDDLESMFGERLTSIGRVLVLFDTWQDPFYLTRVWCVFETYMADLSGVELTIILSKQETDTLMAEFENGSLNNVTSALQSISIEGAEASMKIDEERVKTLIQRTSSFDRVNRIVKDRLGDWFRKQFEVFMRLQVNTTASPSAAKQSTCSRCRELEFQLKARDEEIEAHKKEILALRAALAELGGVGSAVSAVRSSTCQRIDADATDII